MNMFVIIFMFIGSILFLAVSIGRYKESDYVSGNLLFCLFICFMALDIFCIVNDIQDKKYDKHLLNHAPSIDTVKYAKEVSHE